MNGNARSRNASSPFYRRPAIWVLLVAFAGFGAAHRFLVVPPPAETGSPPPPLPELATSHYLNTTDEANYVGSESCIRCHADEHASYLATTHSRSMSRVVPAGQPVPGTVNHAASHRFFEILMAGDQMMHRESLQTADGTAIPLSEFPITYQIGSGRVAHTYVAEDDGFLIESPVTWYAGRNRWDMSPGFDKPAHSSFQRAINQDCLYCHTGRAEGIGGSRERLLIHELAIGCERCHGPGSLHVARHETGHEPVAQPDLTIVNPTDLTRELQEAICQQCHLTGDARVTPRGRSPDQFRPGLPLSDYRREYRMANASDDEMTVVGHVEQLHLSRCWQESETLTCTTCHDVHAASNREDRALRSNASCANCHAPSACSGPALDRSSIDDNCVHCHMPSVPTDVPHVAFTQHRIGTPRAPSGTWAADRLTLVPMQDQSQLSEPDRQRALGLAYWNVCLTHAGDPDYRDSLTAAGDQLLAAFDAGIKDVETLTALAGIAVAARQPEQAEELCRQALESDPTSLQRSDLNAGLAWTLLQQGRIDEARDLYEQVVQQRRDASDWYLLGTCLEQLGDLNGAVGALSHALRIAPASPEIHRRMAALCRQIDRRKQAEEHERVANQLEAVIGEPEH